MVRREGHPISDFMGSIHLPGATAVDVQGRKDCLVIEETDAFIDPQNQI